MKETILKTLREIEQEHDVRIIYAVESGSRAWGFASPDSDYDVRYIYVRRPEDYVRVDELPSTIEGPLDDVLDFSGWDVRKALGLLKKTNPSLMEWAYSPIVYLDSPVWQHFKREIPNYFGVKSEMHHYLSMAHSHWTQISHTEQPKLKRYMYMLRALLCAQWLERFGTMPPVLFSELAEVMLTGDMRPVVDDLLARKKNADEKGLVPHIPLLDDMYRRESVRLRDVAEQQHVPENEGFPGLNRLLRELIVEAWQE
ncbi:MAG: nucleotidyltransferase domain-containing protein [Clostridia bacterium]|nr:nucleotidyltransferase domain-containing protein [Clostridia bacterium]